MGVSEILCEMRDNLPTVLGKWGFILMDFIGEAILVKDRELVSALLSITVGGLTKRPLQAS
jgi:hypothetical protein